MVEKNKEYFYDVQFKCAEKSHANTKHTHTRTLSIYWIRWRASYEPLFVHVFVCTMCVEARVRIERASTHASASTAISMNEHIAFQVRFFLNRYPCTLYAVAGMSFAHQQQPRSNGDSDNNNHPAATTA